MPKFTALAADKLTVKSGRKDFFDPSYPGLALRVSATGRKAWVYFYRIKNGEGASAPHDTGHLSGDGRLCRARCMA